MRKSCPHMGQLTLEESFACWHTCISDLLSYFCFADRGISDSEFRTKNKLCSKVTTRWNGYFSCRDIMTTLEMSLGGLDGPARSVFRANFGDPVQPGSRKRSNGWAAEVLSPPCSRE